MSAMKTLSIFLAGFFPKSEKVISEKLTTEEHASFLLDANEMSKSFDGQTSQLVAANNTISELNAQLEASALEATTKATQLASVMQERDTYKAHYDAALKVGAATAGEDLNSQDTEASTDYNAYAVSVWHQTHKKA